MELTLAAAVSWFLGRRVSVVDTPGLFSTHLSEPQLKAELVKAVELSYPGPNVFLLIIQLGRFAQQEQDGPKILETMLSPDVSQHTMVLFTYGDWLEDTNIDQFIRDDRNLQKLLSKCSGRYHVFNNREIENRDQVRELLQKAESVSQGGQRFYQRGSDRSWWSNWKHRSLSWWSNWTATGFFRKICCAVFIMTVGYYFIKTVRQWQNSK